MDFCWPKPKTVKEALDNIHKWTLHSFNKGFGQREYDYRIVLEAIGREAEAAKKLLVRNCDVFLTREDCENAYDKYAKWNMVKHFKDNDLTSSALEYEDWLFAEYNPKFYNYTGPDSVE